MATPADSASGEPAQKVTGHSKSLYVLEKWNRAIDGCLAFIQEHLVAHAGGMDSLQKKHGSGRPSGPFGTDALFLLIKQEPATAGEGREGREFFTPLCRCFVFSEGFRTFEISAAIHKKDTLNRLLAT